MAQTFGEELKAWRARVGLTQRDAAEELRVNYDTYRGWEIDRFSPHAYVNLLRDRMERIEEGKKHGKQGNRRARA